MTPEKLDRLTASAANLTYILVSCAVLIVLFPGARQLLRQVVSRMVWNYHLGSYLLARKPTPGWVKSVMQGGATVEGDGAQEPAGE
jgi:hypothetical protein